MTSGDGNGPDRSRIRTHHAFQTKREWAARSLKSHQGKPGSVHRALFPLIGVRGNAVLAVLVLEPERNGVVTNAFVRISHFTAAPSRVVEELARR